jgi:hypothetical protein
MSLLLRRPVLCNSAGSQPYNYSKILTTNLRSLTKERVDWRASHKPFECSHLSTYYISNSVRTSHETHYITATEPNRLMLFKEIFAVLCENHTEHRSTYTVCTRKFRDILTSKDLVLIVTIMLHLFKRTRFYPSMISEKKKKNF